jgi:6-phosphogluconate dehydrogenase (decarboxylating)
MTGQEFGVIGLGRIGGGLALQALQKGMRVVGYTLGGAGSELLQAGLQEVRDLSGFRETLAAPRRVFLYIPAGPGVDQLLDSLASVLELGDIAVDGGTPTGRLHPAPRAAPGARDSPGGRRHVRRCRGCPGRRLLHGGR